MPCNVEKQLNIIHGAINRIVNAAEEHGLEAQDAYDLICVRIPSGIVDPRNGKPVHTLPEKFWNRIDAITKTLEA